MHTIRKELLIDKIAGDNIPYRRKTYRIDVNDFNDKAITETTVRMALTANRGKDIVGQFMTYKIV